MTLLQTAAGTDLLTPEETHRLDRQHVFHSWSAQGALDPMVITRAEGSYVWDGQGKRYLDYLQVKKDVDLMGIVPKKASVR